MLPGTVVPEWLRYLYVTAFLASLVVPLLWSYGRRTRVAAVLHGIWSRVSWPWLIAPVLLGAAAAIGFRGRFPLAGIHDEFSYLLAADTFLRGRLANPTPPGWQHFESFHINLIPTYTSMYLPGQGLLLAFGRLLGHAWIGVLVSALALAPVTYWAALAWLPRTWARIAAVLGAVLIGSAYWIESYWGGSLAALGGALLVGVVPRFRTDRPWVSGLLFGAGALLLLFTRPYEGAVLTGVCFLLTLRRWRVGSVLSAAAVLTPGVLFLALFNQATTGNVARPAYVLNFQTYHSQRLFLFAADPPRPQYRHSDMERTYDIDIGLQPLTRDAIKRSYVPTVVFFGSGILLFPLLAIPWFFSRSRLRPLAVAGAAVLGAGLLALWMRPHYLAPGFAAFVVLTAAGLRYSAAWRVRGQRVGRALPLLVITVWVPMTMMLGISRFSQSPRLETEMAARHSIEQRLRHTPGKHLVLISYHYEDLHSEWVYNGADLGPEARVIWARSMNPEADARLASMYPNHRCYRLRLPDPEYRLLPLAEQPAAK